MTESMLFQGFIYLLAAVVMVPVSKRLGLGSVLGYLFAGVVIGPAALNLVGSSEQVMKFADPESMNKSRLSDEISIALASRALDVTS